MCFSRLFPVFTSRKKPLHPKKKVSSGPKRRRFIQTLYPRASPTPTPPPPKPLTQGGVGCANLPPQPKTHPPHPPKNPNRAPPNPQHNPHKKTQTQTTQKNTTPPKTPPHPPPTLSLGEGCELASGRRAFLPGHRSFPSPASLPLKPLDLCFLIVAGIVLSVHWQ